MLYTGFKTTGPETNKTHYNLSLVMLYTGFKTTGPETNKHTTI